MTYTRTPDVNESKAIDDIITGTLTRDLIRAAVQEGVSVESGRVCDLLIEAALLIVQRNSGSVDDIAETLYDVFYNDVRADD